jgi:hypothetical protein
MTDDAFIKARDAVRKAVFGPLGGYEDASNAIRAALSSLEESGWVLVPKEATGEMHDAAREWSRVEYGKPIGTDASTGCYTAMLDARPFFPSKET